MALEIEGKIINILPIETIPSKDGSKTYNKRTFVIMPQPETQYTKCVAFEQFDKRVDLLDGLQVGQIVAVSFNTESQEWQGKYFTKNSAWKIVPANQQQNAAQTQQAAQNTSQTENFNSENSDDLPF